MKIFNLHSNDKKEIKGLKKTKHKEYDDNGEVQTNEYVEYTVIGKNREWPDFMPLQKFKELNPDIKI